LQKLPGLLFWLSVVHLVRKKTYNVLVTLVAAKAAKENCF